jgi:hypothetical protein
VYRALCGPTEGLRVQLNVSDAEQILNKRLVSVDGFLLVHHVTEHIRHELG